MVMLVAMQISVLGDGTVSPPNPIGEKLWYEHLRAHFVSELLPIVILGCAFLAICLFHLAKHLSKKMAAEGPGYYEI